MKAPLRTKSIGTKVSEEEFAALETCARQADMTLGEWVRAVLLAAPGVELPGPVARILISTLASCLRAPGPRFWDPGVKDAPRGQVIDFAIGV